MPVTGAARIIREIADRVRPTIGPTFSVPGGETVEGRISATDFETLVTLAGAAAFVQPGNPAASQ